MSAEVPETPLEPPHTRKLDQWISATDGAPELRIPPGILPAWVSEALAQANTGQVDRAITLIEDNRDPPESEELPGVSWRVGLIDFVLADIYWRGQRHREARICFDVACDILGHALVFNEAARFYSQQGNREKAILLRRRALVQMPDNALILANLGDDLIGMGQAQAGIDLLKQAVQQAPKHSVIGSTWLSGLHYAEHLDCDMLFAEHRKWGAQWASDAFPVRADKECGPERKLRIGYVSSDFCRHSVAYFFEPLLDARPQDQYDVFGYGHVDSPDDMTACLVEKLDFYRAIQHMSDRAVADLVRQDRIDILVDLGGHFRGNRLGVFVYKPAPIQVTYLGYPDTTGLSQIDYRLTDPWADLPDADRFYTECLWPLPAGFLCYRPPSDAPAVDGLPAQREKCVTFASFNNNCKMTQQVLGLWARVLRRVPESRMLLKFKGGDSPELKERYVLAFERLGVPRERVEVLGWRAPQDHLDMYNRVDIALDTYPYNGTTTTCEALWMGVPTVTLVGQHHASRVGLSLMTRAGLEMFVAHDSNEYVDKAVSFAGQWSALGTLRRSLRASLLDSGLCDARRIGHGLSQAYRAMWRKHCAGQ
jgi:protein O-GlcNAc transferase